MIATFPTFSPIELSHREEVVAITSKYAPYSDFNFSSLYAWNTDGTTRISRLGNNLVITLPHYSTGRPVFSALGGHDMANAFDELFTITDILELVPETVISSLSSSEGYKIIEDEANHDYIYNLSPLTDMTGGFLKKKRNKLNRVKTALGSRLATATNSRCDNPELILLLFEHWAVQNNRSEEDISYERKALQRMLEHLHFLHSQLTTIHIDGRLCAFSINEILPNGFALTHFEKALLPHEDMPTYVASAVAAELLKEGCKKINWEQDLGIPGLRQSKLSYHPSYFLKKYTVKRD